MRDEGNSEQSVWRPQEASPQRRPPTNPSSSRMFASYLTDIEQSLEEQRWDAALREALDLPRLAVALADPQLQCSREQIHTWCQEWIRPPNAERDAQGLEFERLIQRLTERLGRQAATGAVPLRALRRLQLRRHLRVPPRGRLAAPAVDLSAQEIETLETCTALQDAARRWYARSACHDPVVQANLARIAVLR
jgi:hypothetical protein